METENVKVQVDNICYSQPVQCKLVCDCTASAVKARGRIVCSRKKGRGQHARQRRLEISHMCSNDRSTKKKHWNWSASAVVNVYC